MDVDYFVVTISDCRALIGGEQQKLQIGGIPLFPNRSLASLIRSKSVVQEPHNPAGDEHAKHEVRKAVGAKAKHLAGGVSLRDGEDHR